MFATHHRHLVRVSCAVEKWQNGRSSGTSSFARQGQLLITAIIELTDEDGPGTHAWVEIGVFADGHQVDEHLIKLAGGDTLQVPLQGLVTAHSGSNAVGFSATARSYSSRGPGDVIVSRVSIIGNALPAA